MFDLTLIDHLRLTFGHVVYRHKAHSHIAQSRALWGRGMRAVEVLLVAAAGYCSLGSALGRGPGYAVASAVLAGLALVALLVDVILNLDGSAHAHATCATRLWHIRERYRALMSDLSDGALDLESVRRRRDELMGELHDIYENAPPSEAIAYQAAAKAVGNTDEAALADEEINLFLPRSLQKSGKPATA
jgi:hypothetical protein